MKDQETHKRQQRARGKSTVHRITVKPHVMEHVDVGTYKIQGEQPLFDVQYDSEGDKETLIYKALQMVDMEKLTYELVYSFQNFGVAPVTLTLAWIGGQQPIGG